MLNNSESQRKVNKNTTRVLVLVCGANKSQSKILTTKKIHATTRTIFIITNN